MADYWKSNDRKFCDFCKCWISDNKASISFHENGKRHKLNVTKRISEISRNSEKAEREKLQMDAEIRKMEKAAMRSYTHDIHSRRDLTAHSIHTIIDGASRTAQPNSNVVSNGGKERQVDPLRMPGKLDNEGYGCHVHEKKYDGTEIMDTTLWVEGKSDDGHTYYWNVKTKESVWKPPKEGYLSWKEFQRINELAVEQQEMRQAEEAKRFRENVNEDVARYNRERLKLYRPAETSKNKDALQDGTKTYKTEAEALAPQIGTWQVVENSAPVTPIDFELPKLNNNHVEPIIVDVAPEPPIKRFKEKTIESLDAEETECKTSTMFKKRKLPAGMNARRPLADE